MKQIYLYLMYIVGITTLLACTDNDDKRVAPSPELFFRFEGVELASEMVTQEGNTLTVLLPSVVEREGSLHMIDLTHLLLQIDVTYGILQHYDNSVASDFSSPKTIEVLDFLYNKHEYIVKVETYTAELPAMEISEVKVEGVTTTTSDISIGENTIEIKVATLTDNFEATNYKNLAITYNVINGKASNFTNGEAMNYSSSEGVVLKFETLAGEIQSYTVKVIPTYVDKGPVIDPILAFLPVNLNWKKVEDVSLTTGVELYTVNEFKPGSTTDKANAWYVSLDLSASSMAKLNVGYTASGTQNIKKWYKDASADNKPFIITNAGFFGGGASYSLIVDNSIIKAKNIGVANRSLNGVSTPYYMTRSALGIMPDGSVEVAWIYNANNKTYAFDTPIRNAMNYAPLPAPMDAAYDQIRREWTPVVAIGGAPVLVKDNLIVCTETAELCDQFTGNRARTAIGVTEDNKIILLVLDETPSPVQGYTMANLAQIMKTLGCKHAINLDGGGSSAMVANGNIINVPSDKSSEGDSRAIPTVVMIDRK